MNSFLQMLPPELQNAPALIAGFLALLGLILLTAGVKVARPLAAAFAGALLATTAACILPTMVSIDRLAAGIIGLAFGLLVGTLAFRAVQGLVLASCLAIIASGSFYQWQASAHPWATPKGPVAVVDPGSSAGRAVAGLPAYAQTMIQAFVAKWGAMPLTLRQSLLVIGGGVAILAIFIAWMLPRSTTWLMSALGGVVLLVYGGMILLGAYLPNVQHYIPTDTPTRLILVGLLVAIGMVVQRLCFWPGKQEKSERAKDRPGELAAA